MANWVDKITTDRDIPFGGHTTKEVKEALEEEAKKQKKSQSELMHVTLAEMLRAKGYKV